MAKLPSGIPIPDVGINFIPAKAGEVIQLGPLTCRIMEDGSNTGQLSDVPVLGHGSYIANRQPPRRGRAHHATKDTRPTTALA